MKLLQGLQTNIEKPLICKITSKYHNNNKKRTSLLAHCFDHDPRGSICLIIDSLENLSKDKAVSFFQIAEKDANLNIGDIVLLEPSGKGTLLFEVESTSNAVLITETCNCRCVMCPQPPKVNDDDDYIDLSLRTISLMDSKTEVLGITGGEPTLKWDGLLKVLSACQKQIPIASIQLLTNARVLKNYTKVKELVEVGGNNLLVCVPLYSDTSSIHDEIVNSKNAFWETVEGIYNLERLHIPIELRTVITKLNYNRLISWSEFIYRNFPFVSHVAFMGMEPIGLALQNLNRVWVDPVDYLPMLEKAVRILNRRNMNISIYNHQLCTLSRCLWHFSRKSISEWKNVFFPECNNCNVNTDCGGFFQSAENIRSRGIRRITH